MRTTLTLDDDVAAMLDRIRVEQRATMKQVVNETLRRGLESVARPRTPKRPYRTRGVNAGRCLIASLDDIEDILCIAEGEWHK